MGPGRGMGGAWLDGCAFPKVADEGAPGSAGVPPAFSESGQDARAPGNSQLSEMPSFNGEISFHTGGTPLPLVLSLPLAHPVFSCVTLFPSCQRARGRDLGDRGARTNNPTRSRTGRLRMLRRLSRSFPPSARRMSAARRYRATGRRPRPSAFYRRSVRRRWRRLLRPGRIP